MANAPSEKQIGITKPDGKRVEPTRCAVSNRDVRGKPHIEHAGPDGKFVYVLAQYDHQWPQAVPAYGFPVEDAATVDDGAGFALDAAKTETVNVYDDNNTIVTTFEATQGAFAPLPPADTKKLRASSPISAPTPSEPTPKDGD